MKRDIDRYYRSTSLSIAVFLFAKGEQIAGVNKTENSKEKEFVFIRTDKLDELVNVYKFGDKNDPDLSVEVHLYEQARRELLDRLNDR